MSYVLVRLNCCCVHFFFFFCRSFSGVSDLLFRMSSLVLSVTFRKSAQMVSTIRNKRRKKMKARKWWWWQRQKSFKADIESPSFSIKITISILQLLAEHFTRVYTKRNVIARGGTGASERLLIIFPFMFFTQRRDKRIGVIVVSKSYFVLVRLKIHFNILILNWFSSI